MYLILGAGISAISSLRLLIKLKKKVSIVINENEEDKIKDYLLNIEKVYYFEDIYNLDLNQFEYVIRSPGISSLNIYLKYLRDKKVLLIDECELAYLLSSKKGIYIGVSGSNGKTSVVNLIYQVLKENNKKVILAGNVGIPLTSLYDQIGDDTFIVLELSSFQLEEFKLLKLDYGILLNLTPNHLDSVESLDYYYQSKFNLCNNQRKEDYFLTDLSSKTIKKIIKKRIIKSKIINFQNNYRIKRNLLFYKNKKVLDLSMIKLKGNHNLNNLKAVISLSFLLINNPTFNSIYEFKPLPFRLEEIELNTDYLVVNDSKSTSINSIQEAINTYKKKKIILLFGGKNKDLDFIFLNRYRLKTKICFGELSSNLNDKIKVDFKVKSIETALAIALTLVKKNEVILFSPGCASFDHFANYEQRGKYFNEVLRRMINEKP